MDQATTSIETHARALTALGVRNGYGNDGDPVQRVGDLYANLCTCLHDVEATCGGDAMESAAQLAAAAVEAGLIYIGDETTTFIRVMGDRARAVHREIAGGVSDRF